MRVRRAVDLCPDSDAALFKRAVKGVIKLSVEPRADVHRPRATPLRRARREEAPLPVAAPALSDDFEPAVLTDEEGSVFPHPHIRRDIVRKLRRGVWRIEAQLDLHHMRRFEARAALCDFLHQAVQRGLRCVRVIHGKGWGSPDGQPVLKAKVRLWLAQIEDVIAFCPARLQHGGEGVVIVLLRSPRNAR
ncbi:Smr protein/MutS2 [Candidatus Glomeribacter gigasporarum BEG34]|uniref:Smr protein/MutS2 n=1 Tax=Candidatus Glomeribacter gigasporarum BEG34 TaxID=1070319 RepID=G2J8K7_9BURK|nr:Smr protein/MutS2 [Candidatus Glomeribacter gigasporarum BEG34]